MKRYLTTTEYAELQELVNQVLTASNMGDAEVYIQALDVFRKNGEYIGSANSILRELYSYLKNMSDKAFQEDRLNYFIFVDSYMDKLMNHVRSK